MNSAEYSELKNSLNKDEAELISLSLQLNGLLRLRDNSSDRGDRVKALQDDIERLTQVIRVSQCALQLCTVTVTPNSPSASPKFFKMLVECGFPRFKPSNQDVLEYLDSFELACSSLEAPCAEWPTLFKRLIPFDDSTTLQWVSEASAGLNWQEVKQLIIQHYQDSSSQRLRETKFLGIKLQSGESLACFCDRFIKAMHLAQMDSNTELCKTLFLSTLPRELSANCSILSHSCTTVRELANLALNIQNTKDSKNSLSQFINRGPAVGGEQPPPPPPRFPPPHASHPSIPANSYPKGNFCFYCKSRSHNIEDCEKRKRKNAVITPNQAVSASCQLNECTSSESTDATNSLEIPDSHCSVQTYHSPGQLFSVPILLNGINVTAHLDSCSQVSILSEELVSQLNLPTAPCSLQLLSFNRRPSSASRLVKEPLLVKLGSLEVQQQFCVCELQAPLTCVLGTDAFQKLNLFIGGFQLAHDTTAPEEIDESDSDATYNIPPSSSIRDLISRSIEASLTHNQTNTPGFCNLPNSRVALPAKDDTPSWIGQYPIAHALSETVTKQIDDWLQEGIIKPAPVGCQWNSSLIVIKKQLSNGSIKYRVCLDPRHINSKLSDDKFPIPVLRDLLDRTAGAKIFSALDLKSSYHQFQVDSKDQPKTAFTWKGIQYVFEGCPFGLKTLTSIFQRVISELFSDFEFVIAYVDDILVFSNTVEEHIEHLNKVIVRLSEANLTLNAEKCLFGFSQLHVLGHVVSNNGIRVDSSKFEDINKCPRPQNAKEVQSFLGLMNYFRDFIPHFARISRPLDELRNISGKDFIWKNEHESAFATLKQCLFSAPILSPPNFQKQFYIASDASTFALGATLFQLEKDLDDSRQFSLVNPVGKKFVKFCSRALRKAECNYPAWKREFLAIVYALKKFQGYIVGHKVTLLTDSKPLSFLLSQKQLSTVHYSWIETILQFNLEIIYLPGQLNVLPDLLSRLTVDTPTSTSSAMSAVITTVDIPSSTDASATTNSEVLEASRRGLQVVPISQRPSTLRDFHALTHCNAEELYARVIRAGQYWLSLRSDCRNFTASCKECQKFTIAKSGFHPQSSIQAFSPMDHVLVDLLGPLPESSGCRYILVAIDVFSRFIFLRALDDKTPDSTAKALYSIFCSFGHPKILQTDNGGEFVNGLLQSLESLYQWDHRKVLPYHPQANGLVERAVRTTIDFIRKHVSSAEDWANALDSVQLKINQRICSTHKSAPFDVMFARKLNDFKVFDAPVKAETSPEATEERIDFIQKIVYPSISSIQAGVARKRNRVWNRRHRLVEFLPGSCVMARNPTPTTKFDVRYLGPFRVVRKTKGGSYVLAIADGQILPRNFAPSSLKLARMAFPVTSFLVHKIVDFKLENGTALYKVRWFGFNENDDTWEPESSFEDPEVPRRFFSDFESSSILAGSDVIPSNPSVNNNRVDSH